MFRDTIIDGNSELETVTKNLLKLEDLKVLRRSPDLLNNVKIGQINYSL